MLTKPDPLKIEIEYPLSMLIVSCERQCVAGCCGINAYDFSPLFIAAYLSTHTGEVRDWDVAAVHDQIGILRANHCQLPLQNIEYTLQIEAMNQHFTSQELASMLNEIEYNLDQASTVWKLSHSIRRKGAEQAEQLVLQDALKRTRLEEAARNSSMSLGRWALWIVAVGLVLYLRDSLVENLWMIVILLLVQIESGCGSVHKRIDAILELDSLDHSTILDRIHKKQNKSEQATPRKPSD